MNSKLPIKSVTSKTNPNPSNTKSHSQLEKPTSSTTKSITAKRPISAINTNKTNKTNKPTTVTTNRTSTATTNATTTNTATAKHISCDDDIMNMLKTHNKTCTSTALYEPARHSVRDVRKWEKRNGNGLKWSQLTPQERINANREIDEMKKEII